MGRFIEPPRLRTSAVDFGHRGASWLELFYDLVYVIVLNELVVQLSRNLSWSSVGIFFGLFIPVWWSWTSTTYYNDRFDTDDVVQRLMIAVQMIAILGMALATHDGMGRGSALFALSYVVVQLILIGLYLRAYRSVPTARPFIIRHVTGYAISTAFWAASLAFNPPVRFAFWVIAMAIEMVTPYAIRKHDESLLVNVGHLTERFRLFTLIVLGEAIEGVVVGISPRGAQPLQLAAASIGLFMTFCIWWIYFDNVDAPFIKRSNFAWRAWTYAHLPLLAALLSVGAGIDHMLHQPIRQTPSPADSLLLGWSVAACLIIVGLVHLITEDSSASKKMAASRLALGGVAAIVGIVGSKMYPIALMSTLTLICAAQVVVDLILNAREREVVEAAAGRDGAFARFGMAAPLEFEEGETSGSQGD